jgi:tetratricopeptide (TPR) repeat protein
MMLKPKKKMHKHDLKEDKFVKFVLQAKTYMDANYQKLSRYVLGVAGLIIIVLFFYYNSSQSSQEANSQLGIAQIEFTNGDLSKANERLLHLIEEFDGTDAAEQGMFLLANIYYQQKKYADAKIYFEKFTDAYSGSNILLASGYAGLAACEETSKNFTRAAELYEKAGNLTSDFPESDHQYYLAALLYKKAGDLEKAKNIFSRLAKDAKSEVRMKEAETQLVLLDNTIQ